MPLDTLYHLADLVADAAAPEEIYEAAVDAVMTAARADRASILIFDDVGVMRFRAWRGLSDTYRAAVEGHSPWARETKDPAPVLVPDVLRDAALAPFRAVIAGEGIRALAFIPLVHQRRLVGKFMVYYDAPHEFSHDELQLVRTIAHHVAFGLDHARAQAAIGELLDRERVARHEAEAASTAKDDFLAMLAHELRNPLAAIVNAVSILDRAASGDVVAERARAVIRRQTTQLTRLLDDLLDLARVRRDRLELRVEPLDLRAPIERAVEAQRPRMEAKDQALRVALPDDVVAVLGDAARLQQIVANLLDNASKYTPGGGDISLRLVVEDGHALVRVRDSGCGIPVDALPSIFEPFARLNAILARTEGGLGIGLALVRQLVELHRGTVEAHSEGPGTGAELVVRLPLDTAAPRPVATEPAVPATVSPCSIVVIEDNDDAREALGTALRFAGHRVHEASTGRMGIDLVLRERPDVVVVDIGLPDLDGYTVARSLRQRLGGSVHLIAVTGYGQPQDVQRAGDAGFDAHVVKPVAAEDLLRARPHPGRLS